MYKNRDIALKTETLKLQNVSKKKAFNKTYLHPTDPYSKLLSQIFCSQAS